MRKGALNENQLNEKGLWTRRQIGDALGIACTTISEWISAHPDYFPFKRRRGVQAKYLYLFEALAEECNRARLRRRRFKVADREAVLSKVYQLKNGRPVQAPIVRGQSKPDWTLPGQQALPNQKVGGPLNNRDPKIYDYHKKTTEDRKRLDDMIKEAVKPAEPAKIRTKVVKAGDTLVIVKTKSDDIDVQTIPQDEARELHQALGEFFGGAA